MNDEIEVWKFILWGFQKKKKDSKFEKLNLFFFILVLWQHHSRPEFVIVVRYEAGK